MHTPIHQYQVPARRNRRSAHCNLSLACRRLFGDIDYQKLRAKIGEHPLVVTQGKRGAEYESFDVILVTDQAETEKGGVLSDSFREVIADISERNPDKIVIADSRARIDSFRHVIAKPNLQEADQACRRLFGDIDYQKLRAKIGEHPLVVTQGNQGKNLVPTVNVENPVDICGAGDSFAAGMALALYASGEFEKAVRFGNLVSSVTIMKEGTGAAAPAEVLAKANSLPS